MKAYYGGVDCTINHISIESLDFILDLMDEYVELVEALGQGDDKDGNISRKPKEIL